MESVTKIFKDGLESFGEMIATILALPLAILAVLVFCYLLLIVVSGLDKFYNLIDDLIEYIKRK